MKTDANNRHLSAKDIAQWLVEGPIEEAEAHVANCWNCQGELAEAREPLTLFRAAVTAWSESQPAALIKFASGKKSLRSGSFVDWIPAASAVFALLVLAVFVLEGGSLLKRPGSQRSAQLSAVSDTALMEQVDQEVSETVPDAMAPLTDLVAWDSTQDSTIDNTAKHIVDKKVVTASHAKARGRGTD